MKQERVSSIRQYVRDLREWLGQRVYSQEGEDLILARYFEGQREGFFVDVGAHHPHRFSNTYLLYRQGWRGVNIDAMPGSMRPFRRARPRDINLEVAIGTATGSAIFYMFNEPALNTFDAELARQRQRPPYHVIAEVPLSVRTLADVLGEFVPASQPIDLLTIDVEGRDLEVLKSNDWQRFRPKMILAETRERAFSSLANEPIVQFLEPLGYVSVAKTFNTTFMMDAAA